MNTETETPAGPDGTVRHWRGELDRAGRAERDWMGRADKVVERYRADKRQSGRRQVNILWANTEILKPAVYSQTPAPDVRRRYLDDDPVGREAALGAGARALLSARRRRLRPGDGGGARRHAAARARRRAHRLRAGDRETAPAGARGRCRTARRSSCSTEGRSSPTGSTARQAWAEEVTDERVRCRHVFWKDYREQPAQLLGRGGLDRLPPRARARRAARALRRHRARHPARGRGALL